MSFNIHPAETFILLGPSGCGKTTLLKLINRLIEPDRGEILINGQLNNSLPSHHLRRSIGYVIQDVGLLKHLTIGENIGLVNKLEGQKISEKKLSELLELIGLPYQMMDRYPVELSGGQQQRVGIARALANNAPVILMDEPFSALDSITRNQLQDDFLHLKDLNNKTIVMVTHDIQEAFKLGDRIVILNEGVIQQIGTPNELLFYPANDFVKSFLKKDELIISLYLTEIEGVPLTDYLEDPTISAKNKSEALSHLFKK
ncbi:MAG: ATP-binding cassette domain-containing protein [Bacteroidota bacterium]